MKMPDYAMFSRRCAYAAVGIGVLWLMLVTGSRGPDGGFRIFCNALLAVSLAATVLAPIFAGLSRARGVSVASNGWRIFKRVVFCLLPVLAFALAYRDPPACRVAAGLLAMAWMAWGLFVLVVWAVAFVVSCMSKQNPLEGE